MVLTETERNQVLTVMSVANDVSLDRKVTRY